MSAPALSPAQRAAWNIAAASWLALLALTVLWEWRLAPLRPGGSWLILKAVPLLLPLRGVLRGDVKVMQWALLLVLLYIAEGGVRAMDAPPAGMMAMIEIGLGLAFFAAAIVYLRPFKQAARARART
jgi:uncharacterized membrane protein